MNFVNVLKAFFASFLQSRHFSRHFRRIALFDDTPAPHQSTRHLSPAHGAALTAAATDCADILLARLGSHAHGLTAKEADSIRERIGLNETLHEQALPAWKHLWLSYRNPFNLLLTLLAVISWATDDVEAALIIGVMVTVSTLLRFWQEGRANAAADALKAMVSNTATVLRRDAPTARVELPITLLVPGEIIVLAAGDMIPADCRILTAKDLFVAQAAMTGEAMPVEKFPLSPETANASPLEHDNLLFMGTNVVSGAATAVVVHTGANTFFGALAASVTCTDRAPTAFQAGVNQVSWLLIRFMLVMAPLVLFINGFTKGDWLEATLFALSVAVGLTPEMLPMIVTSTLAKGAVVMSRRKVIIKRLDAIQNFGAMDVLCTDKTGTLTQDKIVLARHCDTQGKESAAVLQLAWLNSHYQTGLKNLLDVAVLEHVEVQMALNPSANYRKVDEIPFDFQRRRMSVVVCEREDHHELITKGAFAEVVACCTTVQEGGAVLPLDAARLYTLRAQMDALAAEGLRVVAVAMKEIPATQTACGVADECALTLMGTIAFLDPAKESTAPALRTLAAHGVAVKVLTGDNERVAAKVCRDVGIAVEAGAMLTGGAIETMNDAELAQAVEAGQLFARLTPAHKERIVRILKAGGHVVGFMGDGINDAPALRAADIGISVDTAVDIAKEAADIILLEKSLMVLEAGVLEGRRTFVNMLKYVRMTASSNFGNVFSVLVASAFLPFLPMLPIHLLTQNLLYDLSQTLIPFDNVDDELVARPLVWNPKEIARFMVFFGPVSSLFDILTYAMMWFVFVANTPESQRLFQTGWFVVGLLTQTLVVHMIRTPKIPFVESRAATPLLVATGLVAALGIFLPMGPLGDMLPFTPLPPLYFALLPLILLGYMALTQALKGIYVRRYGW